MVASDILELYNKYANSINFQSEYNQHTHFFLKGLNSSEFSGTSLAAVFLAANFEFLNNNVFVILKEKEDAAYFYNDLQKVYHEEKVLFFPSSFKRSASKLIYKSVDNASLITRTEVLNKIYDNTNYIIVSYPEAVSQKVIDKKNLDTNTLPIQVNEKITSEFVVEVLESYNFSRVDFVYEPGQFALRGSILDIFSYSHDYPYRIDFFGDEVESIRSFDTINQLSKSKYEKISIIPDLQTDNQNSNIISIFDFLPENTIFWIDEINYVKDRIEFVNEQFIKNKELKNENEIPLISEKDFIEKIENRKYIETGIKQHDKNAYQLNFDVSVQPRFNAKFNLIADELINYSEKGYQNYILSENENQLKRLNDIFQSEEINKDVQFNEMNFILHNGFIDHQAKIVCFTDHQIFERYHKFNLKSKKQNAGKEALTIQELQNLQPGDYVVHVDHGIGIFGGLERQEVNGKTQEVIRLVYKDKDVLFVSIHSLHRISKYKGKEGIPPKIYKLGSSAWQNLKKRTKSKVKDIAKDLIALYAKRLEEKGFSFSQDSYLQQTLEASFIYEDTPDQVKATIALKQDMESEIPMDRLVCGDVGFGKTEIAIRAAFKAVADSKQVAVLVPTTILALQHYKTFSDRLFEFPCNVEHISRLKSTKEQKEIIKKLEKGQIDILIGTHRIVSKDIKFNDLGLLIIDEEQKFGVSIKEKLKQLRVNVDTLTLTATPIPRTLQFSLMGARDLSIIQTPPPNRYPIVTEVHNFNEDIIREAINYEIDRNGQVFIINNRVQNIYEIEALINRICPDVRTIVAHGQMEGKKLEKIMLDFINQEYGVLIATTIIESGLDIPNANTIIINNAQNFGLSDLHQLRGRVGRTNKKAFCYLLTPPPTVLTPIARERLKAIENFSELGSGFNIALQDLDIRGAGNLLGAEQSGFIADIGYETYQRILDEALLELRENEFKELFNTKEKQKDDTTTSNDKEKTNKKTSAKKHVPSGGFASKYKYLTDCTIDTDLEVLFPENYIENITERVKLYRQLDNITTEEELNQFAINLTDRFGKIPEPTTELLNIVRLRWKAIDLGIERIILKSQKMICYFISNPNSSFFQSPDFTKIIEYLQENHQKCQMKESKNKLALIFKNTDNVNIALNHLKQI